MNLSYDMPFWRPPSEGNNLIIQATLGCSFNRCTFCSMYREKEFQARPLEDVFRDIDVAARLSPRTHRVFLADGDALVLPTDHLIAILERLAERFPNLQRVALYATPIALNRKSPAQLEALKAVRLSLVYLGIESGSDAILKRVRKGATQETIVSAIDRAKASGMRVSATVILGLGGQRLWEEHIDGTAQLINRAPPTYLSTLQLQVDPSLAAQFNANFARFGGSFVAQDDLGILDEQARLVSCINSSTPVIFRSNHASNCLPLEGNLPRDADLLRALIDLARYGAPILRPSVARRL